jgi:hypothetical protein
MQHWKISELSIDGLSSSQMKPTGQYIVQNAEHGTTNEQGVPTILI